MNRDTYGDFSYIYKEEKGKSFSMFPLNIDIAKEYSEYQKTKNKRKWYQKLLIWKTK